MTVHPHFRRMHHLLYLTATGVIFASETSPSSMLPSGWGAISVADSGVVPTGRTHKIDITVVPHALVALTDTERAEMDLPSAGELALRVAQELAGTDQFMVPDRPMQDAVRSAWVSYRQALRDLSKLEGIQSMIAGWPSRPDGGDPISDLRSRI